MFALTEFDDDRGHWHLTFRGWEKSYCARKSGTDRLDERILAAFRFDQVTDRLTHAVAAHPAPPADSVLTERGL